MSATGKVEFHADKVKLSGPKLDGSWTVSFETGEYEQEKLAELLKIPQQTALRVTVEIVNE